MEHMESKMQDYYDAGEARMERLCFVAEKLKEYCKANSIDISEVVDSIDLHEKMGWEI